MGYRGDSVEAWKIGGVGVVDLVLVQAVDSSLAIEVSQG